MFAIFMDEPENSTGSSLFLADFMDELPVWPGSSIISAVFVDESIFVKQDYAKCVKLRV